MSEEWRQSLKLLEPGSFNMHKNTAVSIITILGYLELDTKVSNTDMEHMGSNDCRGMLKANGNTNGVLATM